jgi:MerR family copper efflux transcriptional regulator
VSELIGSAAGHLGATPRMLRYRESLGLLAPRRHGGGRRRYGMRDLAAAQAAAELEERYRISPRTLAFALRMVAEPQVAADVGRLATLTDRLGARPLAALDFEAAKARRLLESARPPAMRPPPGRSGGGV